MARNKMMEVYYDPRTNRIFRVFHKFRYSCECSPFGRNDDCFRTGGEYEHKMLLSREYLSGCEKITAFDECNKLAWVRKKQGWSGWIVLSAYDSTEFEEVIKPSDKK
jgi:hypothetical protein